MYRDLINDLIDRYGSDCHISEHGGRERTIKAFAAPMLYKYGSFGGVSVREDGMYDDTYYLLIAKVSDNITRLPLGSTVSFDDRTYRVDNFDIYSLSGEPLYVRIVLRLVSRGQGND